MTTYFQKMASRSKWTEKKLLELYGEDDDTSAAPADVAGEASEKPTRGDSDELPDISQLSKEQKVDLVQEIISSFDDDEKEEALENIKMLVDDEHEEHKTKRAKHKVAAEKTTVEPADTDSPEAVTKPQ